MITIPEAAGMVLCPNEPGVPIGCGEAAGDGSVVTEPEPSDGFDQSNKRQ